MNKADQAQTPLADALLQESQSGALAFDVPGHKSKAQELKDFFGEKCLRLDLNSRPSIDNICQPTGAILRAEELAAEAFGARHAFFMVGGTTSAVQAMVLCSIKPGEEIILPRNVHVSVINAVILAGGVPVYVNPSVHERFGIPLGMSTADVVAAMTAHPQAKAIVVNNPTYYGVCSDLESIVKHAHARGMRVLADEAHGTHFYFGSDMPVSAMAAGADMSAVSMHKTGGSLTQSSVLLVGGDYDLNEVRAVINLTMTTSASYLLLASLDITRKRLATAGNELIAKLCGEVYRALDEIDKIDGFCVMRREDMKRESGVYDFDPLKISVNTTGVGLAGIEVYSFMRERLGVQLEFGDISNVLAIPAMDDQRESFDRLVQAFRSVPKDEGKEELYRYEYVAPVIALSPREAFYMPKRLLSIKDAIGKISGEYVNCYPPGIPLLAPGELITQEVVEHIFYSVKKGCKMIGGRGDDGLTVSVVDK